VLPGGKAYTYLPASVRRFPEAEDLLALLERSGFERVRFRLLGGSIVALHVGVASGAPGTVDVEPEGSGA
jgi:demethylmenaquinone methyltransferase/2-methoxy-6-polyprenyl-1,4-benzoquinol methylase